MLNSLLFHSLRYSFRRALSSVVETTSIPSTSSSSKFFDLRYIPQELDINEEEGLQFGEHDRMIWDGLEVAGAEQVYLNPSFFQDEQDLEYRLEKCVLDIIRNRRNVTYSTFASEMDAAFSSFICFRCIPHSLVTASSVPSPYQVTTDNSEKLFKLFSKHGNFYSREAARAWIKADLSNLEKQRLSLDAVIHSMIRITNFTLSNAGSDYMWEHILKYQYSRDIIHRALKICSKFESPFDTIAQIICVLVKLEKNELAEMVFSKVFIRGRHFQASLNRLELMQDLKTVEKLAHLFERFIIGEMKQKKHEEKGICSLSNVEDPTDVLLKAIGEFIGIGKQKHKKKTDFQKTRIKKNRVDAGHLFCLLEKTRDVWIKLSRDEASIERCRQWCDRVDISFRIFSVDSC